MRSYTSLYFQALSDLLVRQKQVTIGLPSQTELIITQPLAPEEIAMRIESVCTPKMDEHYKYKAVSPHCMLHQVLVYASLTSHCRCL